jgi:ribosomal-protein-alanine N-acetyltransferase
MKFQKLHNIYQDCFPNRNAKEQLEFLEKINSEIIFEKDEEVIVTFLFYKKISPDEAEILDLGTLTVARRKGLAEKLMAQLIENLKGKTYKKLFLEVSKNNITACNLYKKLGFEVISIRKNYYLTNTGFEDCLLMAKTINA